MTGVGVGIVACQTTPAEGSGHLCIGRTYGPLAGSAAPRFVPLTHDRPAQISLMSRRDA